jgi:hypothetical protein
MKPRVDTSNIDPHRDFGTDKSESGPLLSKLSLIPFILVSSLFFLWGIPINLHDILIRQFMKSFLITRIQAELVKSAFYTGYFLLALPSALYMRKLGYKVGFATGLSLFSLGTLLSWPAVLTGHYSYFLFALFVMASGLAFLEIASNTFITVASLISLPFPSPSIYWKWQRMAPAKQRLVRSPSRLQPNGPNTVLLLTQLRPEFFRTEINADLLDSTERGCEFAIRTPMAALT